MERKTGWAEKRQHERVTATLGLEYRIVTGPEAKKLLSQENYSQTTLEQLPKLPEESALFKAVTKDLSLGGLSFFALNLLEEGMILQITLHLPDYKTSLKFLAQIRRLRTSQEMGKTLYNAGLQILAIHKGDIQRIEGYLSGQKNKDDRAGNPPLAL